MNNPFNEVDLHKRPQSTSGVSAVNQILLLLTNILTANMLKKARKIADPRICECCPVSNFFVTVIAALVGIVIITRVSTPAS